MLIPQETCGISTFKPNSYQPAVKIFRYLDQYQTSGEVYNMYTSRYRSDISDKYKHRLEYKYSKVSWLFTFHHLGNTYARYLNVGKSALVFVFNNVYKKLGGGDYFLRYIS